MVASLRNNGKLFLIRCVSCSLDRCPGAENCRCNAAKIESCASPPPSGEIIATIMLLLRHLKSKHGASRRSFPFQPASCNPNSFRLAPIHHCPVAEKARNYYYSGAAVCCGSVVRHCFRRPREACSGQLATSRFSLCAMAAVATLAMLADSFAPTAPRGHFCNGEGRIRWHKTEARMDRGIA